MATFTWPTTLRPLSGVTLELVNSTEIFRSGLTAGIQTSDQGADIWRAQMSFRQSGDARAELMGFLAKLRGSTHRVIIRPYDEPRVGVRTGTPVVNGASQTGYQLVTDGWTPGTTRILARGDYISFNDELHIVADDVNSDGGGAATINIEPYIRVSPANNDAIEVTNPQGTFVKVNSAAWQSTADDISFSSVEFIEAVFG